MDNLFNKNGFDILIEGINIEEEKLNNIEAFDNLDVAVETLDAIIKECRNDFIELQHNQYLDELIIENMIYTDFNENNIVIALEAMSKNQRDNIIKKLKAQYETISNWFSTTIKTFYNLYTSSEKLIKDNKTVIPTAMRNSDIAVKMNEWEDLLTGLNKCANLRNNLNNLITTEKDAKFDKEAILNSIGAKDRFDVRTITRKAFIRKENVETKISNINPNQAMSYATNMKKVIDSLKKEQAIIDASYKQNLTLIQSANDKDVKISENMSILDFVICLKLSIIRTEVSCIKQASTEYTYIIRKALSENSKRQNE
jgi:hypothetical protein